MEALAAFRERILRIKDVDHVPMVVIGNKVDLEEQRLVTFAEVGGACERVRVHVHVHVHVHFVRVRARVRVRVRVLVRVLVLVRVCLCLCWFLL